jgi:hypothetical protein
MEERALIDFLQRHFPERRRKSKSNRVPERRLAA